MSARPGGRGWSGHLVRAATWAFPRGPMREQADEIVRAAELERRRVRAERGGVAGVAYALRAAGDVARRGLEERMRNGPPAGHGARPPDPRTPLGAGLAQDVRLAARRLRSAPGFTLAAAGVLALGIGANTTVFSALRAVILSPPPYPEPERLVLVDVTREHLGRGDRQLIFWSYPKFEVLRGAEGRLVDPIAGYANRSATLTGGGPATRISFEYVSPEYFGLLGVVPVVGRVFGEGELDPADAPLVAVLSHELWASRFGADPAAVGRTVTLDGHGVQVVGVAPPGFDGLTGGTSLWLPIVTAGRIHAPFMIEGGQGHWFHVLGRLRPDATLEAARDQIGVLGDGIAERFPGRDAQSVFSASLRPFEEVRVNESARAAVVVLTAGAILVLLVACANLSGLLLARARRDARAGSVRVALGASRWRLVRASLIESLALSVVGGALAIVLALWGTRSMAAAWPRRFLSSGDGAMRVTDLSALSLEPDVVGFAIGLTVATAVLFGAGPALGAARADPARHLKEGTSGTRRGGRFAGLDARSALVSAQVGLALVLLIGTGLVATSTQRLLAVDEGFRTERLLLIRYSLAGSSVDAQAFHEEFLARVDALPRVEGVTIGAPPLRGSWAVTRVDEVEGEPPIPSGEGLEIRVHMVGDDHFGMLGIPLLDGRELDRRDGTDRAATVVIGAGAARALFGEGRAVGRRIRTGVSDAGKDAFVEIVGVVGDVLYGTPDRERIADVYYSMREFGTSSGSVTVRTSGDPRAELPAIRAELAAMDPTVALYGVATMDELVRASVGDRGVVLALLAIFALTTVLLAAVGTWGVVSYSIEDRRRELGLRLALGAQRGRVIRMVLRESLATAVLGVMAGLLAGAVGTGLLRAVLWQTEARDPVTFAGGALLLTMVVLAAGYVPARRVTRLDPAEALQAE